MLKSTLHSEQGEVSGGSVAWNGAGMGTGDGVGAGSTGASIIGPGVVVSVAFGVKGERYCGAGMGGLGGGLGAGAGTGTRVTFTAVVVVVVPGPSGERCAGAGTGASLGVGAGVGLGASGWKCTLCGPLHWHLVALIVPICARLILTTASTAFLTLLTKEGSWQTLSAEAKSVPGGAPAGACTLAKTSTEPEPAESRTFTYPFETAAEAINWRDTASPNPFAT